jgi:hypothetical protein
MQQGPNKTPSKVPNQNSPYPSPYQQFTVGVSPNVPQNQPQVHVIQSPGYPMNQMRNQTIPMQYQQQQMQPPQSQPMNPNMIGGFVNKQQIPQQFTPQKQPQMYGQFQTPPTTKTTPTMQMGMTPTMQPQFRSPVPMMQNPNMQQQGRLKEVPKTKQIISDEANKHKAQNPDYKTQFQSFGDISERLSVYQVYNHSGSTPDENWDQKVTEVTKRFVKQTERLRDVHFTLVQRDSRHAPTEESLFMDNLSWKEEQQEWEIEKKKIIEKRESDRIAQSTIGSNPISFKLETKKAPVVYRNVLDDDDDDDIQTLGSYDDSQGTTQGKDDMNSDDSFNPFGEY